MTKKRSLLCHRGVFFFFRSVVWSPNHEDGHVSNLLHIILSNARKCEESTFQQYFSPLARFSPPSPTLCSLFSDVTVNVPVEIILQFTRRLDVASTVLEEKGVLYKDGKFFLPSHPLSHSFSVANFLKYVRNLKSFSPLLLSYRPTSSQRLTL